MLDRVTVLEVAVVLLMEAADMDVDVKGIMSIKGVEEVKVVTSLNSITVGGSCLCLVQLINRGEPVGREW